MWGAKVQWPCDMADDLLEDCISITVSKLEKMEEDEQDLQTAGVKISQVHSLFFLHTTPSARPLQQLLTCVLALQEIKKYLDDKWRPHWHCIIGKNFGCYATHESKKCVYFYFKDVAVMLFKT